MGKLLHRVYVQKQANRIENTVPCMICGRRLKAVNSQHLTKHNITYSQYRENYPTWSTYSMKTLKKCRGSALKSIKTNPSQKKWLQEFNRKYSFKGKYSKETLERRSMVSKEIFKRKLREPLRREKHPCWKGGKIKKKCPICGKEFLGYPDSFITSHKFCSKECMGKGKITKIKTNCDFCGKEIFKRKYEFESNIRHFCSKKCYNKHRRSVMFEKVRCDFCDKTFKRMLSWKKRKNTFCSHLCANSFINKKLHPGVFIICKHCGKRFRVSPSRKSQKYCSTECWRGVKK